MRIEINYWDTETIKTEKINEFDELLESFFKEYGFRIEMSYFEIATGVRTLGLVDGKSRYSSLEYH